MESTPHIPDLIDDPIPDVYGPDPELPVVETDPSDLADRPMGCLYGPPPKTETVIQRLLRKFKLK